MSRRRRFARLLRRVAEVRVRGADLAFAIADRALTATERALSVVEAALERFDAWLSPPKRKRRRKRRAARPSKPKPKAKLSAVPGPSSGPPPAPRRSTIRIEPPRARCVVDVGKKTKSKRKSPSARAHRGGKGLAAGVERVRRIDVTRELLTGGVHDEGPTAFLWNFLVQLVFTNVLTGRRGHQEFLRELHRQIVARVRNAAVWIGQKCVGMIGATTARASRLLADLHHRLHSLRPLTRKGKPARARGNHSQPSTGPASQKRERRAASKQARRNQPSAKPSLRLPSKDGSSISQTNDRVRRSRRKRRSRPAAS